MLQRKKESFVPTRNQTTIPSSFRSHYTEYVIPAQPFPNNFRQICILRYTSVGSDLHVGKNSTRQTNAYNIHQETYPHDCNCTTAAYLQLHNTHGTLNTVPYMIYAYNMYTTYQLLFDICGEVRR